jgi:putative ABC transport system permease protein
MWLAVREVRRSLGRFALASGAVGLLLFLLMFQQTLQDVLITAVVGGVENQSAPIVVYSVEGQRTLRSSSISPDLVTAVAGVPGVGQAGPLYAASATARTGGETPQVVVVGFAAEGLGSPARLTAGRLPERGGEVVVNDAAGDGFHIGDTVKVGPVDLVIVGTARDVGLDFAPTLFGSVATFKAAVRASNPDAGDPPPNALVVVPADGVPSADLIARINATSDELDALSRVDAAMKSPQVEQTTSSLGVVFLLYALVVPCVLGLFFLIVTFQKARGLALLRALGVSTATLLRSLLAQTLLVLTVGAAIGACCYLGLVQVGIGGVATRFDAAALAQWTATVCVLGVASALLAARRVMRVDPLEATTNAGVLA